jgi:hypothetical protein
MRQLILLCGLVTLAFGLGVNQEINFFSRAFYDDNIFMKADGSEILFITLTTLHIKQSYFKIGLRLILQ